MINKILFLAGILVICQNTIAEEKGIVYKNNVAVNLLALPVANAVVSYEHNFGRKSLWLGLEHHFNNLVPGEDRDLSSVALEYRRYLKKSEKAANGFFAGIYTKFRTGEEIYMDLPSQSHNYQALFTGLNAGYQLHFNRFVISGFAGYGIPVLLREEPESVSQELNEGYKQDIRIGVTAGFAF